MRRSIAVITLAAMPIIAPLSVGSPAGATVPPGGDDTPPVTNDFMDLERDVSDCISAMPKPGCGREPTSSGDRGGWQQLLLFGVLMLGMAGIGVRVAHSVRARDRASTGEKIGTESDGS